MFSFVYTQFLNKKKPNKDVICVCLNIYVQPGF